MSEGANRIFLRKNPLVEKEFLKRLKRGDTTIELAEYLKTTKWPGSTVPASVSAFIQKAYPKENMQLLLDAGYTEFEIKKMTPAKKTGLKDSIKSYRKILIPHLKKYDGTIESLVVEGVRDNKDLDYQLKKFRKETDPKLLKLLEKELGNPKFKTKIAQNQLNKLVESGGTDAIRIDRSLTSNLLKEQTKPINVALNWIGDNASKLKYGKAGGLELFIKDYETKFGKLGKDPIFTRGSEGDNIRTPLTNVNKIKSFSKEGAAEIFSFKKGFSEEEIFKAALAQNNKSVQKRLIEAFRLASENRSYYADLGIRALLEDLGKNKTNILGEFKIADDVKMGGSQEYGGVGGGVLRRSLNALGITPKQLSDYQFIRKPLTTLNEIINSLSRKDADGSYIRDKYGLTSKDAKFVQQNFQKIEAGRKSLNSWLKESEKILGKDLFRNTLGSVNFEHSIAKGLGAAYKYLPRDYLLRGQYTPESFNLAKRDIFDKPLINLMKQYDATGQGAEKIQNLISRFNQSTNNYAGDLVFEDGRLKMLTEKVDVDRYIKNPNLSVREYLSSSQLGKGLKEFAPKSTSANLKKLISGGEQIKKFIPQKFLESIVTNARAGGDVCELPMIKNKSTGGPALKCVDAVNDALEKDPKRLAQEVNKSNAGGAFNKVKNSATKFLTALKENPNLLRGSLGSKIALGLGTVAAGAGAGALVKQFRNDDPSTYLTNDSQMEGMIIADVEQKGKEVDDNILLDNQFKLEAAAAAGLTAPIAKKVYQTARGVGEAGPLPEGVGRTRAALGLEKGVLGKGLWALGAPIIQVPSTLGYIAQDVREGKDVGEIATNPLNYLGAAFMNPAVKALGKAGMSRGLLGIASLGLAGTAALPALSIGAGLATLGTLGYQGYKLFTGKNRSDEDFFR